MAPVLGSILYFLHGIRTHRWLDIRLQSWLIFLLLLIIPLAWLDVIPGGQGVMVAAAALILILLAANSGGDAASTSILNRTPRPAHPLRSRQCGPRTKWRCGVQDQFWVEGKAADFTHLLAYYRTFETREHAIMARYTPRRFFIGHSPSDYEGMWYVFITPEQLQSVEPGAYYFGGSPAPGLRLRYTRLDDKGKPRPAVTYLSFDTGADRDRVHSDLTLDLGGPAQSPWRPPNKT